MSQKKHHDVTYYLDGGRTLTVTDCLDLDVESLESTLSNNEGIIRHQNSKKGELHMVPVRGIILVKIEDTKEPSHE